MPRYLHYDEASAILKSAARPVSQNGNEHQLSATEAEEFYQLLRRDEASRRAENSWYLHTPSSAGPWPGPGKQGDAK